MQCILCEVEQDSKRFPEYSPICKVCITKLVKLYKVDYSVPVKNGKVGASLLLIRAVRNQAVEDGRLRDFEEFWIESSPWNQIISAIYRSEQSKNTVSVYGAESML